MKNQPQLWHRLPPTTTEYLPVLTYPFNLSHTVQFVVRQKSLPCTLYSRLNSLTIYRRSLYLVTMYLFIPLLPCSNIVLVCLFKRKLRIVRKVYVLQNLLTCHSYRLLVPPKLGFSFWLKYLCVLSNLLTLLPLSHSRVVFIPYNRPFSFSHTHPSHLESTLLPPTSYAPPYACPLPSFPYG